MNSNPVRSDACALILPWLGDGFPAPLLPGELRGRCGPHDRRSRRPPSGRSTPCFLLVHCRSTYIKGVGVLSNNERALNDGKPVKTRLNWMIPDGKGINMWSYNAGDAANLTTGRFNARYTSVVRERARQQSLQ